MDMALPADDSSVGAGPATLPHGPERQARELIAALPAAVYTTDAEGRITFYNEAAAALWGHRPELGRSEWCGSWRLFHPDGRPMPHDQCPMAVALKEGRAIVGAEAEAAAERPDGTRVPFLAYPTPLWDQSGRLIGAVNTLIDMTEHKCRDRAQLYLAAIVESSDDAIVGKDLNGIVASWNRSAEAMFGYRADEIVGRSITLLIPAERLAEEDMILGRLRRGERLEHYETVRHRKDGREIDVSLTISPIRDAAGRIVGASKIARDITKRKRAEALLECQRKALQMLAERAPLDGVLEFLVRTAERHAAHGMLGSILLLNAAGTHFERGVGPSLPEAFNAAVAGVGVSSAIGVCGQAVARGEPVVAPDFGADALGTPFADFVAPYGLRAGWSTPISGSEGKPLGTFANYYREPRDPRPADMQWVEMVTRTAAIAIERARADAVLRERHEDLEARVAARTRELEAAAEAKRKIEAELHQAQRLEAIGQLTGGVAHDFNNLLTVVLGQAENIIKAAGADERIVRMATAARRAAERGAQLTGQLLAFARRQQLRPESVSVEKLIGNITELLGRAIGEAIRVQIEVDAELWPSQVDPAQFESALLNLAINARDAMPEGGTLTIAARNLTLSALEAWRRNLASGDYVVVSVADTGRGMSDYVLSRCFEPFFTTKDLDKGTGLGLAQIYGFARQSGGTAAIDSAPGQGTTVSLYLPRAVAAVGPDAAATEAAGADGKGRTILVVEDQPAVREIIASSLEGQGYRIITADDGVAASRLLEGAESIDLLLSDVVMPNGISGIDLARTARRLRPDVKVVLVSGFTRNMQPGPTEGEEFVLLEKPFRPAELAATIASVLARYERPSPPPGAERAL